jgi:signal peptidase I
VSPAARRYFGCVLPLLLCVFGCGTMLLLGYAGQVLFQIERVPDANMAPLLTPGSQVIINNMAYWSTNPRNGQIVTIRRPDGWSMRRVVAVPGETVEVRDGRAWVDGAPRDPGYEPHGTGPEQAPLSLGPDEYFVLADDRTADDSRTWGAVRQDAILGRVLFVIGPDRAFNSVEVTPTPPVEVRP